MKRGYLFSRLSLYKRQKICLWCIVLLLLISTNMYGQDFELTFTTTNPGASTATSFIIPAVNSTYDIDIDVNNNGTYGEPGIDVTVAGLSERQVIDVNAVAPGGFAGGTVGVIIRNSGAGFTQIQFLNDSYLINGGGGPNTDPLKLVSIDAWGTNITWASMHSAFYGCANMEINATDAPTLGVANSFTNMFRNCSSMTDPTQSIQNWNVTNVLGINLMFSGATNFNAPLNNWENPPTSTTSNFGNMNSAFSFTSLFDQPLDNWNTDSANNMKSMFESALAFNGDLDGWNVSNVQDFSSMFRNAASFNKPLNGWVFDSDGPGVGSPPATSSMGLMFSGATSFSRPLNNWDVSEVVIMSSMFLGASNFNESLAGWNVSKVADFRNMFVNTDNFNQSLDSWIFDQAQDGSVITPVSSSMEGMFRNAAKFDGLVNSWNTSQVVNMARMFEDAVMFGIGAGGTIDLSSWDTSNVTDFNQMFLRASSFNGSVSGWDVSSCTSFAGMFQQATSFNQSVSNWNFGATPPTSTMVSMFRGATSFNGGETVGVGIPDLTGWNTANVTSMANMFRDTPFNGLIDGWDVSNVSSFNFMFQSNTNFNQSLNGWVFDVPTEPLAVADQVTMRRMFIGATAFNQDLNSASWNNGVISVIDMSDMFQSATAFDGDISGWVPRNVTLFFGMFLSASAFGTVNGDLSSWDVSSGQDFTGMFQSASKFNSAIGNWNMSNATDVKQMFLNASEFNQDISTWERNADPMNTSTVSNALSMRRMFSGALLFNQDISNWDVSNNPNFELMFANASAFNQNLGAWDLTSITNGNNMLDNSGLTRENWDATLQGWEAQNFNFAGIPVTIGAFGLEYCSALAERFAMETNNIFNFVGDQLGCNPGGVATNDFAWYQSNNNVYRNVGLDPATDGDALTSWVDITQNTIIASPVTTGPVLDSDFLNFNPGLTFNNTPLDLDNTNTAFPIIGDLTTSHHIVVVYQATDQTSNFYFASDNPLSNSLSMGLVAGQQANTIADGDDLTTGVNASLVGQPNILSFDYNYDDNGGNPIATRVISLNGASIANESLNTPTHLPLTLTTSLERIGDGFTTGTASFNGTIAELIIYPLTRTGIIKRRIESYLAIKYGITLSNVIPSEDDYLMGAAGSTIAWIGGMDGGIYDNDIAGIFRDDETLLHQRIGTSANSDAIITMALENDFTTLNDSRVTDFDNDVSGLIWGNNNGVETDFSSSDSPLPNSKRWARIWFVKGTNFNQSVSIRFTSNSIVPGNTYSLISESDGDGVFLNDGGVVATAEANGNTITFVNVPGNMIVDKYITLTIQLKGYMRHGKFFSGGEEQPMKTKN